MSAVLIVSHEPLLERMSGPSIRVWELATALSRHHRVTLAAPGDEPQRASDSFLVKAYDGDTLPGLVSDHDVVQISGYLLELHPVLGQARHLVVDLYCPFPLESLHVNGEAPMAERAATAATDRRILNRLAERGDVFLCASERQRDLWTGWLAAVGRVNPQVHEHDPGLRGLLRVVPFGVPEQPPEPGPPRFRGVVPGIAADDFIVLWGGGIWNWFDPLTLIAAAARVRHRLPNLRIIFPSPESPSPVVQPMRMATEARRLAAELSVTDSVVFFGREWVPYEHRGALFLEADLGVSLHFHDVETRYSFRTRVLDYLWAGLPILTTEGDSMADQVAKMDLGAVVPYQDVDAVAQALITLVEDRERLRACAARSRAAAKHLVWSAAARPLLDYCASPQRAPDRPEPAPVALQSEPSATPELDGQHGDTSRNGRVARLARAYLEGRLGQVIARRATRLWQRAQ